LHLPALGLLVAEVDRAQGALPQVGQVADSVSPTTPPYTVGKRSVVDDWAAE
jgi:hypothetical protein